jgi:hypothetical protein
MRRLVAPFVALVSALAGLVPVVVLTSVPTAGASGSVIYVDGATGSDADPGSALLPMQTIQAGIDAVDPGGAVLVRPGNYSETAANRSPASIAGTYTFGLFLGKNGVTVQGVHSDDTPITSRTDPAMPVVTTNSTANFGPDGVFVEGDGVTLTGLHISENLPSGSCNKTIEVVGDDFTFSNGIVNDPCGGDIYINDFRFDEGTDTPHVNSYTITGSEFGDGNTIDIASGAGHGTPASNRLITNNEFVGGGYWPAISFNGADSNVPWFEYPVGGATITGNTFDAREQYIRARGTYDSTFDWQSYFDNNTFPRATLTKTSTNAVRAYSYSFAAGYCGGMCNWNNVRRINGTLQAPHASGCVGADCNGDVDNAQAGDKVQLRGTFNETVSLTKAVSLRGIAAPTLNGPGSGSGVVVNAPGALTIQGIKFAGSNPSIRVVAGSVTPVVKRNALGSLANQAATAVDARCNWWGSATGPALGQWFGPVVRAPFLTSISLGSSCTPQISVSTGTSGVAEGNSGLKPVNLTVSLNGPWTQQLKVSWYTSSATAVTSDYVAASGTLTFAPGQTTKTVTIQVRGDTVLEPFETFAVVLTNPVGGVIAKPKQAITIQNDEKPTLLATLNGSVTEGSPAKIDIVLGQAYYLPVTIHATSIDGTAVAGSDFQAVDTAITIGPGSTGAQTLSVPILVDGATEPNQTFTVRFGSTSINNDPKKVNVTIGANNT